MINSDLYWKVNEANLLRVSITPNDFESNTSNEIANIILMQLISFLKENKSLDDFQRLPVEFKTMILLNDFYLYTYHKGPFSFFYYHREKYNCLVNGIEYFKMKSLLRWFNGLKRSSAKWEYPLNATYDEFEEANPQFPTLPFIAIREKFILDNPILKIVEVIKKTPEKFLVTDDGSPLKIKVPKS